VADSGIRIEQSRGVWTDSRRANCDVKSTEGVLLLLALTDERETRAVLFTTSGMPATIRLRMRCRRLASFESTDIVRKLQSSANRRHSFRTTLQLQTKRRLAVPTNERPSKLCVFNNKSQKNITKEQRSTISSFFLGTGVTAWVKPGHIAIAFPSCRSAIRS